MNKKEHILKTAQALFSQFGLNKVNMEEIAREANVARGTLYKYYKDKLEIFREVVRLETDQLISAIELAVANETTVENKLKANLRTKLTAIGDLVNFYRVTQESWNDHWPYIEEVKNDFILRERAIVVNIIELGNSNGEFAVQDPLLTAHIAVIAQESLEYPWAFKNNGIGIDIGIEELVDRTVDLFINGIKCRDAMLS